MVMQLLFFFQLEMLLLLLGSMLIHQVGYYVAQSYAHRIFTWFMSHMSMFPNALLGGGVRVRVWIREQRKIERRSKALLRL